MCEFLAKSLTIWTHIVREYLCENVAKSFNLFLRAHVAFKSKKVENLVTQSFRHRRINLEELAKIVAAGWGTCLNAALAI